MYHRSREPAKAAELLADAGCKEPMIVASRRQCAAPEFITMAERLPARSSFHGVTAETGLDALTHAVEAYIGRFYNTRETRSLARQAVEAIYRMNRRWASPNAFPVFGGGPASNGRWAEANRMPVPGDFRQGGLYPHSPPGDAVSLGG